MVSLLPGNFLIPGSPAREMGNWRTECVSWGKQTVCPSSARLQVPRTCVAHVKIYFPKHSIRNYHVLDDGSYTSSPDFQSHHESTVPLLVPLAYPNLKAYTKLKDRGTWKSCRQCGLFKTLLDWKLTILLLILYGINLNKGQTGFLLESSS